MLDSIQYVFDIFPEPMLRVKGENVTWINSAARYYLPQLEAGAHVPDYLELACAAPVGSGCFTQGPNTYLFSTIPSGQEQLIFFRSAPQRLLTQRQMDGVLRHMRELLAELMGTPRLQEDAGQAVVPMPALSRNVHRMFRLVNNLTYMQQVTEGEVRFHPVTLDLSGLCRGLVSESYELLKRSRIDLEYESLDRSLLIPGDPELLRRMLLELITNAVRSVGEGVVKLSLRRTRNRAVLTLSDNGPLLDRRQLDALLQEGGGAGIPLPGQGAGLGLPIARHVVSLHRGEMITSLNQSTPSIMISLPTGPLESRALVNTPTKVQQDGGLSQVLVALSDILPKEMFTGQELD